MKRVMLKKLAITTAMFYKNLQKFKQAFKVTANLNQRFCYLSRDFRSRPFIPVVLMGVIHREIPYNI